MQLLRVIAVISLVLIPGTGALHAQALTPGTWTGSAAKEDGEVATLTFDVTVTGDSIAITINDPERGNSFAVLGVKLANNTLSFSLPFGPDIKCVLSRQTDDSYLGTCQVGEGKESTIQMFPPGKE